MERQRMVAYQIEGRGIHDPAVIAAMQKVPRHLFLPEKFRDDAYRDGPLPIGYGQTISQPYIVAYMTSVLKLQPHDKVLEIGTGSGYQAAVLSEIVDSVFTIEIIEELARRVKNSLKELNYRNIFVKAGDGYFGWKEHAPFDKIIVTAAAEKLPPLLFEQLKEGGIMVIPIGPESGSQHLEMIEKINDKPVIHNKLPVRFVPFTREQK